MKKLILILSVATLLVACSKKQDAKPALTPHNATIKDVMGKWALIADTTYITDNGQTTMNVVTSTGGISFQFNADGTGSENVAAIAAAFTYSVSGGAIILSVPATPNSAAQTDILTIKAITTTKLVCSNTSGEETQVFSFIKE
jgi:hypothetical protein